MNASYVALHYFPTIPTALGECLLCCTALLSYYPHSSRSLPQIPQSINNSHRHPYHYFVFTLFPGLKKNILYGKFCPSHYSHLFEQASQMAIWMELRSFREKMRTIIDISVKEYNYSQHLNDPFLLHIDEWFHCYYKGVYKTNNP